MTDALERLKGRSRPTVPSRDASLTLSKVPDTQTPGYLEVQVSTSPELKPPALHTKQTTMRLEQGLGDRLQELCRDNGISREVLIEAMFEYCEANPSALEAVLRAAQAKNEMRQQIANQKRAQSMMQRFGQSG
jgi:hypothetical protein